MTYSKTNIVVVGGSYAGIDAVIALAKVSKKLNIEITLVEPRDHFHNNLAFLRAATQKGVAEKCFAPFKDADVFKNEAVKHIRARVSKALVDRVVLEDGREIAFDYLILATGSRFGVPGRPSGDTVEEVLQKLKTAQEAVEKARRILIVGGGAVGIELAGEITDLTGKEVTLVTNNGLIGGMPQLSDKLRSKLEDKLKQRNVKLILDQRVTITTEEREIGYVAETREWQLSNGESITADLMFACLGHTGLNTALAGTLGDSVLNADTQEIRIRPTMQLIALDNIFAVGDCNDSGRKLAFVARLQAAVATKNIIKLVKAKTANGNGQTSSTSTKLDEFKPLNACIIPIGARDGASQLPVIGVVGRTLTSMFKGKDLFVQQTHKMFNSSVPTL